MRAARESESASCFFPPPPLFAFFERVHYVRQPLFSSTTNHNTNSFWAWAEDTLQTQKAKQEIQYTVIIFMLLNIWWPTDSACIQFGNKNRAKYIFDVGIYIYTFTIHDFFSSVVQWWVFGDILNQRRPKCMSEPATWLCMSRMHANGFAN